MKSASSKPARRFVARRSKTHGRGVFATTPIPAGTRIIEYKGDIISEEESERRYPDSTHTFLFGLEDGRIIDGGSQGNTSRWINHSCDPNCEAIEENGRVFIYALRDIDPGEEMAIDYSLDIDAVHTDELKREYACGCGVRHCRGTLLGVQSE